LPLAIAASFVLSPIVWGHYYVLLVVPLALLKPTLSAAWLAAAWLKPDTLALRHPAAWVVLALLVLLIQLDLSSSLSRWYLARTQPRARTAVSLVGIIGFLIARSASAEPGLTREAALNEASGRGTANGAATFQLDRRQKELCWRIWTEHLPPSKAVIRLTRTSGAERPLILHIRIGRDGQSHACTRLKTSNLPLADGLASHPSRYRLVVAAAHAETITGRFLRQ